MVAATAISTTATRKACLLFRYTSVSVMLTDNSIISVGESDNRIEQSYNHYCSAILSAAYREPCYRYSATVLTMLFFVVFRYQMLVLTNQLNIMSLWFFR